MTNRLYLLILALFLLPLVNLVTAQSSESSSNTEWRMFHRFLNHSGYTSASGPVTNDLAWTYSPDGGVVASSAVAYGMVYFLDNNGYVHARNASTGSEVWNYSSGGWGGIASPAVAGGVVFVSAGNGFYALDAFTGAYKWSSSSYIASASPAVAGEMVFFGSAGPSVYALDASDGSLIWSYSLTDGESFSPSSPAVVDGVVYIGAVNIYALDASNGSQIWNYSTGGGTYIYSSPAVVDGMVYFGSSNSYLYALDASNGGFAWRSYTSNAAWGVYSSPAVANGVVYVGSTDGRVYAFDASDGSQVWNHTTTANQQVASSPAVAGGIVYTASEDAKVYALNASDGSEVWSYATGGWTDSSPAVAGGALYISSSDGTFYAFGDFSGSPDSENAPAFTSSSGKNLDTDNFTFEVPAVPGKVPVYNWYLNGLSMTVLNMPFEIRSSTVAKDYSGYGNNGTVNGAVWTSSGKLGAAYGFDGIDNYISVPASDSLALDTQAIEMWFKPAKAYTGADCNTSINESFLIGRVNSTFNDGLNGFGLGWINSDVGDCWFGIFVSSDDDYVATISETLTAGTWYHVVVVFDDSTSQMKLYLNGVLRNSSTYVAPEDYGMAYAIGAEQANDTVTGYFNGSIDEVRVYGRVLSSEQIAAHYSLEYNKIVSQELSPGDRMFGLATPHYTVTNTDGRTFTSNEFLVNWGGNLRALLNISHTCACGTNVSTTGINFGSLTAGQVSGIQSMNFSNVGSGETTDVTIEGTTWNASLTQSFGENYTKWSNVSDFAYGAGTSVAPSGSSMNFNLTNNESKLLYFRVQVPLGTTRGSYAQTLTLTTIC